MKRLIVAILLNLVFAACFAQHVFMTRNGQISFYSKTPMENIEAINNEVNSILNPATGDIVFAVLIKSFRFERALMEEHFNENYMESAKLPKSTFQGKIINLKDVDFGKDGTYPATVEGDIIVHGVKQRIKSSGTIVIAKGKIAVVSAFSLNPKDFNIEIPSLVAEKIARTIDVKINCHYEPKS